MSKTLFVSKTEQVRQYVDDLCDALAAQYEGYHRRMIEGNVERFSNGRTDLSDYAKGQLAALDNGTANLMRFRVQSGRKYFKIIQQDYDTFQNRNEYRDGSVHAFVDKITGDVYKPAGWAKPAQHVRYNLLDDKSRENCLLSCDWSGGYLYMR
tara:strand:+ start:77 stop:535 length:459 start_codon:yes stop_codon:yes gene_type:complete